MINDAIINNAAGFVHVCFILVIEASVRSVHNTHVTFVDLQIAEPMIVIALKYFAPANILYQFHSYV